MRRRRTGAFVYLLGLWLTGSAAAGEAEVLPPRAVARLGSRAFWHGQPITAAALSPDGRLAATAALFQEFDRRPGEGAPEDAFDQNIRLWEVPSGKPGRVLKAPAGPVMALAFSPDGKTLAAGDDKAAVLWDVAT